MNQRAKVCLKITGTIITVFLVLFLLQRLLMPKYEVGIIEGAFIAEYYDQDNKDFDVLFIGDCEVYENFSPVTLWTEYGINSYIRGSADQYIWQSYYLLEDCLRYSTPHTVVFNVLSMKQDTPGSEAYNRMSLEGMEWSMAKVNAIKASMTKEENFLDYVFPILRYHSRWSELTTDDVKYMFADKRVSHNGYYMRVDVRPAQNVPTGRPLADYAFGENAWKYLNMMRELCEEKGINLVLIKAPSLYPYWYEEWDQQIVDYAAEHNLTYINFLDCIEEAGIDFTTDTYDAGMHMNLAGAEKLSTYFGRILSEEMGVPSRSDNAELSAIWEENIAFYEEAMKAQYEKYGIEAK